ncbi:LysE family translocator [Aquimarina agarilytica]|uniref:LysE family translocator n=1 Tax=Aquimarina agarilytica TaxID=1087449 RepID=UPI0002895039|nr:LysE family transporter [Aquimarina agarilytica]
MAVIEGFVIGFSMIIFIGPVFFLLLNSSLEYGIKAGVLVALGIIFSDIICVLLCVYGLSSFIVATENQFLIGILSGVLLMVLGFFYLFKEVKLSVKVKLSSSTLSTFFIKGFSVNFFNPFVFVVWVGVFNYGKTKYVTVNSLIIFLTSVLIGILVTDLLKVILSKKLKKIITKKRLNFLFKGTGVILILFSLRMIWYVYTM